MGNCCCKGAKEDIPPKAVVYSVDQPSQPAQGNVCHRYLVNLNVLLFLDIREYVFMN